MSPQKRLSPRHSTEIAKGIHDFSGGIVGNVSDLGLPVGHVRRADNAVFEPHRAIGVRPGYRKAMTGALPYAGHSIMVWYHDSGNVWFVGAGAKIYRMVAGGNPTEQTLPITPADGKKWSFANINGAMIAQQEDGGNPPIAYNGTEWLSTVFPIPAAPTFGANTAGGSVDAGTHAYRVRWRFRNGSSLAGASANAPVVALGTQTVNVNLPAPTSRSDFVGWSLERKKIGDTDNWWLVNDGTAATYADQASDASLGQLIRAEPGVHGGPPTVDGKYFDGIIEHRNRMFGWIGSRFYFSREVADEAEASGPFNYHPAQFLFIQHNDGDRVRAVTRQGDRLMIFKSGSTHALEGFDIESFLLRRVAQGLGVPGPRCACSHGGSVYIYAGSGRIYRFDGDTPYRIGEIEVGHYLAELDTSYDDDVVVWNYHGDKICWAYTATPDTYNRHVLAQRITRRIWEHSTEIRVADVVVPARRSDFGGARMVWADPKEDTSEVPFTWPTVPIMWSSVDYSQSPYAMRAYVNMFRLTDGVRLSPVGDIQVAEHLHVFSPQIAPGALLPVGEGDFIFAYQSGTGSSADVYVQRVNVDGSLPWGPNGVPIATAAGTQNYPVACSDEADGCIVTWNDNADIRAQRISEAGVVLWAVGGVVVCNATGVQRYPDICSDMSGGAIVAWADQRAGAANENIWAQRINGQAGAALWAANGVQITTAALVQAVARVCSDGLGGAVISWFDYRRNAAPDGDLYAQRIDGDGLALWLAGGLQVNTGTAFSFGGLLVSHIVVPDGTGGAVFAWPEAPSNGSAYFGKVRRVDGLGVPAHGEVDVGVVGYGALNLATLPDGGVVAATNSGTTVEVFRISPAGAVVFNTSLAVPFNSEAVALAADGDGGLIVGWGENDADGPNNARVQRLDGAGNVMWQAPTLILKPYSFNVRLVRPAGDSHGPPEDGG